MSFLNLFKKKPKKKAAQCSICKSHMEHNEGFALNTSQVVVSEKYWDHKMVEPETMSYTTAHFKGKDENATKMRGIIFEKTAEKDQTWLTCDTCIKHFDVDQEDTKFLAGEWWASENGYKVPDSGGAKDILDNSSYENIKNYATQKAGEKLVRL
jgi:hypothetical protein